MSRFRWRLAVVFVLLLADIQAVSAEVAPPASTPFLVVLTETDEERDGLPVLAPHPEGERIAEELNRGISADLTTVYRWLQTRQHRIAGSAIEPAYLLLSSKQGGFARYGFWLNGEKKEGVAFVDVHRDWSLGGRFGAVDQIFPHELAHATLHRLGVEASSTAGANQVHAVGVRTDRTVAFNEGFAEHFQVMAVDHADANPDTRALALDEGRDEAARRHLMAYASEMSARISPATRMRVGFPLWYSNDERVLRYFAVKRNGFAYTPSIPERLLETADPYRAYLLENVLPGDAGGEVKPVARLLATEGAMSTLFYRWATNEALQRERPDAAFYEAYGVRPEDVSPLQNVYLKLFHVVRERKPTDAAQLIEGYREVFPNEAAALDALVAGAFAEQPLDVPPEIWLANDAFRVGTTLFDQFRSMPRTHTFDLNAASIVDLMSVPGMSLETARAVQAAAPFQSIDELTRVPGVDAELSGRMKEMARSMARLREKVEPENLALSAILLPYLWRLSAVIAIAAFFGIAIYTFVRRRGETCPRRLRLILNGLGAAIVAMAVSWISGSVLIGIAAVVVLCGLPATVWCLWRKRAVREAFIVFAAWAAAAIPGVLLTGAWF